MSKKCIFVESAKYIAMNKFLYLILCILLLSSCKVINIIPIDYLEPADVSFPASIRSVGVVNNTPQADQNGVVKVTPKAKTDYLGSREGGVVDCNAQLATEELAQNIAEGNYFDKVIICDSALRKKDYTARETKLSQQEVRELTEDLDVDAIFSLELARMYVQRQTYYQPDYPAVYPALDAKVGTLMRIYLPTRSEPMMTFNSKDSIFWIVPNAQLSKELVDEASAFAATLPVKYLLPTWKTVERHLYASGSIEMRDAAVYVREDSWDEAFKLWLAVNEGKNEKMKMRSAFNIALYYEIKDDLDQAMSWAKKALTIVDGRQKKVGEGKIINPTEDYKIIALYIIDLEQRIADQKKLNLQMERFNGDF